MSKTYEPTDQELIQVVGTWKTEAEINAAGYYFDVRTPVTGEAVVVHSHGKFRRGIVTSVGRLRAAVVLVTPTSIKNAREGYKVYVGQEQGWMTSHELARTQAGGPVKFAQIAQSRDLHPELSDEQRTRLDTERTPDAGEVLREDDEDTSRAGQEDAQEPASDSATETTGSAVVAVLERTWEAVRANHPELPPVVIVTGSGFVGPPRWGHFRANGWAERAEKGAAVDLTVGEMFVAGETLAKGAEHTVETMLHEAAHVLAGVRDVKDTSRQGRWHNQRFRQLAEELGLEYTKSSAHPQAGFSECLMTPGTREDYAPVIEELDRAIRLTIKLPAFVAAEDGQGSGGEFIHGAKKPRQGSGQSTNNVKATCQCPEPRIIRASRKVLDQGFIACGLCHQSFEPEETEADSGA